MKAAVLRGPYVLTVEDVPRPKVRPGYVVVNVKATAVCGTDVGIYNGKIGVPRLPVVQGHESTGEIVEVGADVADFKVGDRVVLNSLIFCRHCAYCYAGKVNLCPNGGLMGREVDGTFAEYVAVPDYNCIKIPESISYEDGTGLIALATVFRSHEKIHITPGDTVAVIGQGAAGLLQTRLSVISGADPVFAVARSRWKLDLAEKFGARIINAGEMDPVSAVREATGGLGVDLAIESVGAGATLRQAMDMVRLGGTVLFYRDRTGRDGPLQRLRDVLQGTQVDRQQRDGSAGFSQGHQGGGKREGGSARPDHPPFRSRPRQGCPGIGG